MTRLLVTRPARQAAALVDALAQHGIGAVAVPTVATLPPSSDGGLDAALRSLEGAAWLVITSVNGATALLDRLSALGMTIPAGTRLAAVGPATAAALRGGGLRVDHVPAEYRTVTIAAGLGELRGARVVLARADAATPDLAEALRALGASIEEIEAYRTMEGPPEYRDSLHTALRSGIDGITFTSGSTVRGLLRLATPGERRQLTALPAYCIGPVTADAARLAGFVVPVVAAVHTVTALATAIAAHLATEHLAKEPA
jgi:uroporphyrinogen III methyltransferase/synthase